MTTPTEPTTPQPKPADAAGLLPCFDLDAAVRAAMLAKCDPGAFTPRGNNYEEALGAWEKRAMEIALAPHRAKLPTPHAAEAGVRDEGLSKRCYAVREEMRNNAFPGMVLYLFVRQEIARHRTAAETVVDAKLEVAIRRFCRANYKMWLEDAVDDLACIIRQYATPPATQSALEQAREALEFARDEIGYAGNKRICDALAALAAVLPPAKGGAQG